METFSEVKFWLEICHILKLLSSSICGSQMYFSTENSQQGLCTFGIIFSFLLMKANHNLHHVLIFKMM